MFEAAGAKLPGHFDGRSFLPQLLGRKGNPRSSIYCWFDPRPGHDKEQYTRLVRFARDQRFKLYDDGRLFDVQADELERHPITAGGESARRKLQAVLDRMRG